MSKKNVIGHGFSENNETLSQFFTQTGQNTRKITDEASEILKATGESLMQNFQRKNIDGQLGRWSCLKKSKCVYLCVSQPSYPERLAYQLLNVG